MIDITDDLGDAADKTVRVPANLMHFIRASYDSREKILDWMMALGVTAALAYAFRDELRTLIGVTGNIDPNAGRDPNPVPNQDIPSAFPHAGPVGGRWPALYNYNMPTSRRIRYDAPPSGTRPPDNPSRVATFEKD